MSGQSVWLRLVDQLDKIRDPDALPGWLATTTRRECARVLRTAHGPHAPVYALDAENLPDEQADTAGQDLLAAERHAALREAFTRLPPAGQRLIGLLIADPPVPYAGVSVKLAIPVGSIGPSRCLDKLHRDPAPAAVINAAEATCRPATRPAVADQGNESVTFLLTRLGWMAECPRNRADRRGCAPPTPIADHAA
jgi:hypothetical protein